MQFTPGQRCYTPHGRTIEIQAVSVIEVPVWDSVGAETKVEIEIVAYHFIGGSYIHIRKAEDMVEWPAVPEEA